MRIFLDFDDCLANNAHTVGYFLQDAIALCGQEQVTALRKELGVSGFTIEAFVVRLGLPEEKVEEYRTSVTERSVLFDGMIDGLRKLREEEHELILLSGGVEKYQRLKIDAIDGFAQLFSHIHIVGQGPTKGDVVAGYGPQPDDCFVDDVPKQLADVRAKAPWVRGVRMMYSGVPCEPHEGDGVQWAVVHSMKELLIWLHAEKE